MSVGLNATQASQAQASVPPQAGTGSQPVQQQAVASEQPETVERPATPTLDLEAQRRKNQENKSLRLALKEKEAKLAEIENKAKVQEEAARAQRGEYEGLYHAAKQHADALNAQYAELVLERSVERAIAASPVKPKPGALADIMALLPRGDLRLKDGKVEGLEEALAEFAETKPWFFDAVVAEADGSAVTQDNVWISNQKGLPGYRPDKTGGSRAGVTDDMRMEAERRGLSVEDWQEILQTRDAARASRSS